MKDEKIREISLGEKQEADEESLREKMKYPRSVAFIISNEFCERFNYYGMRTILVLYLTRQLSYSQDTATVIFHAFAMMVYLMCIFGAILADSWLGKFKTIFYLSMVYVAGSVLISVGAVPPLHLPGVELTIAGLLLIAIGSGGIKPCVAAFGGDQFKLPEQVKQMATFFSLFYFAINSGSLISTTVTPILRENVHCFGATSCYSLAFGVPAILMAVSIVIFVLGRPLYISKPPEGNMFLVVSKAIGNAIGTRCKERKSNPRSHWLDYADGKYDRDLIEDIKVLLRVLVLYIPLPIFWALFDQQGSRWTFQATRMDGIVGAIDIKPDQLQMLNPLLILILIPLYDFAFYPLLAKVGVRRPLQKLTIGGVLAGIAFIISGVVELQLEKTYPVLPTPNVCQFRIFNGIPNCDYTVTSDIPDHGSFALKSMDVFTEKFVPVDTKKTYQLKFKPSDGTPKCDIVPQNIELEGGEAISFYLRTTTEIARYTDYVNKPEKGNPEVRILANLKNPGNVTLTDKRYDNEVRYDYHYKNLKKVEILSSTYDLYAGGKHVAEMSVKQGAEYTILLTEGDKFSTNMIVITEPNSMNILWLIPQYFVMTLGEVMFSVTGLEFSYSQAPSSMKSVLQACWQLTVALGNLIVIIVAEVKAFKSQAHEFFLFAGLMLVDMILFSYLAYRYKPNNPNREEEPTPPKLSRISISRGDILPNIPQ